MKFSNKKETRIVPSIYILLVAVFVTNLFAAVEIRNDEVPFNYSSLLPNLVAVVLAVYIFFIGRSFEFDSDGETINFKSNGLLVSNFLHYRDQRTEIPKSKLTGIKIENYFFFKRLHLFIRSRNSKGFRHYKYNITFLKAEKIRALKISLGKIVEQNKSRA